MRETFFRSALLLLLTSTLFSQTIRESGSTRLDSPGTFAFDDSVNTAWAVRDGASGWIEARWDQPQNWAEFDVNVDLPQGAVLTLATLDGTSWIPLPERLVGPLSGVAAVRYSDRPSSGLQLKLEGTTGARVWSVNPVTVGAPTRRLIPRSYTYNQTETINNSPPRLWDGRTTSSWYDTLTYLPPEAYDAGGTPLPVFPRTLGDPAVPAEVVWDLGGSFRITLLKAAFLAQGPGVRVDFWNGQSWVSSATLNAAAAGWNRLTLQVTAQKVRYTFPAGWSAAKNLAEVELWGSGASNEPRRPLVVSTDGRTMVFHDAQPADSSVELVLDGDSPALSGMWNGQPWNAMRKRSNPSVFVVSLPAGSFRTDAQFLSVDTGNTVRAATLIRTPDDGRVDFVNVSGTAQLFDLRQGETLRLHSASLAPAAEVGTAAGWRSALLSPLGGGWWSADLGGGSADRIRLTSGTADQVSLWGTSLAEKPTMELWWPRPDQPVTETGSRGTFVSGWRGTGQTVVTVNGQSNTALGAYFGVPFSSLGWTPGGVRTLSALASLGGLTASAAQDIDWRGSSVPQFDQGTTLESTSGSSLTLSGTAPGANPSVTINGSPVAVSLGRFTASVPLSAGFQNLAVEVKSDAKLLARWVKPVFRSVSGPSVVLDQLDGLLTRDGTVVLSGRVGGAPTMNAAWKGAAVTLTDDRFVLSWPLVEGLQTTSITVSDPWGVSAISSVTVVRDTTAPAIALVAPVDQSLSPTGTVAVTASSAEELWWKQGDDPWQIGSAFPVQNWADGWNSLVVQARDPAGNTASVSASVLVDTTPPVPFTPQLDVAPVTNFTTVALSFATADAGSGIDRYEVSLDGGAAAVSTSPTTLTGLVDGEHSVRVTAYDRAGWSRSASVSFRVDTTPPSAVSAWRAVAGSHAIELRWTEPNDDVTYRVTRVPAWDAPRWIPAGAGDRAWTDEELTDGQVYTYTAQGFDAAGNAGAVYTATATAGETVKPVDPEVGGTVEFQGAVIDIPADALPEDVTKVVIREVPAERLLPPTDPENQVDQSLPYEAVGQVLAFTVEVTKADGTVAQEHTAMEAELEVTMAYDADRVPEGEEGTLAPYYFHPIWQKWLPIPGALVDTAQHTVRFTMNHFTDVAVLRNPYEDYVPNETTDWGPLNTAAGHAPLTVSPQTGTLSTAATDLVLPGNGGLDLVLRRVYSSSDSSVAKFPWAVAKGWRFDMPSVDINPRGLWVTGWGGKTFNLGQARVISRSTSSTKRSLMLVLEAHEDSNTRLYVSMKLPNGSDSASFRELALLTPDGVVVLYDSSGRVKRVSRGTTVGQDANDQFVFTNEGPSISFAYDTDETKHTTITDTRGRVVTLDYGFYTKVIANASGSSPQTTTTVSVPVVDGIRWAAGAVSYSHDGALLTAATDAAHRRYEYVHLERVGSSISYSESYPDVSFAPPRPTKVAALESVQGPGLGYQSVVYGTTPTLTYSTKFDKYDVGVHELRLIVDSVTVGATKTTALSRTTQYSYTWSTPSHKQFFITSSTVAVSDGTRPVSKEVTTYKGTSQKRTTPQALSGTLADAVDYDSDLEIEPEVRSYPARIVRTKDGESRPYEVEYQTWDVKSFSPVIRVVDLAPPATLGADPVLKPSDVDWAQLAEGNDITVSVPFSRYRRQDWVYDAWGFLTKTSDIAFDGAFTAIVSLNEYAARADVDGLVANYPFRRGLLSSQTTVSSGTPASSATVTTRESTSYDYFPNGLLNTKKVALSQTTFAETGYQYEVTPASPHWGEVVQVTGPTGLLTSYQYGDATASGTYDRVVMTQTPPAPALPRVTTYWYDHSSGLLRWTRDAEGFFTEEQRDALGRLTLRRLPADTDLPDLAAVNPPSGPGTGVHPTTSIGYRDTLSDGTPNTGLRTTVLSPLGAKVVYDFDNIGQLQQVERQNFASTASSGETITTTMGYDALGNVTKVKGPRSSLDNVSLDELTTTFTYDGRGRVLTMTKPPVGALPSVWTTTYSDATGVVVQSEPADENHVVRGKYLRLDPRGNVVASSPDPSGTTHMTKTSFDGLGRALETSDPQGSKTRFTYNSQGLLFRAVLPERTLAANGPPVSPIIERTYDANGSLTQETRGDAVTEWTVDALGQVTETRRKNSNVAGDWLKTKLTYDKMGRLLSQASGPLGATDADLEAVERSWTYDPLGRVKTSEVPYGDSGTVRAQTQYGYDLAARTTTVTDPRLDANNAAIKTVRTVDYLGRLVKEALPTLTPVEYQYNGRGLVTRKKNPDGVWNYWTYDLQGRLSAEGINTKEDLTGASVSPTQYVYNPAGRLTETSLPSASTTQDQGRRLVTTYNALGQVYSQTSKNATATGLDPAADATTSFEYDLNGNLTAVYDPRGNVTRTEYNVDNLVSATVDAAEARTEITRDLWGRPVEVLDGELNLRQTQYDLAGRVVHETDPLGHQTTVKWDDYDRVQTLTDPAGTIFTNQYTLAGQLSTQTAVNGTASSQRTWTYDLAGDLKTASEDGITTSYNLKNGQYAVDPLGLARSLSTDGAGVSTRMEFDYDAGLRTSAARYGTKGQADYQYDALGRLSSLSWTGTATQDIVKLPKYDNSARLTQYQLGNNVVVNLKYNQQDQISSIQAANTASLYEEKLTYDLNGNIENITIDGATRHYTYDAVNRLTVSYQWGGPYRKSVDENSLRLGQADYDFSGNADTTNWEQGNSTFDEKAKTIELDLGKVLPVTKVVLVSTTAAPRVRQRDLVVYQSTGGTYSALAPGQWTFEKSTDNKTVTITFPTPVSASRLKVRTLWDDRTAANTNDAGLSQFNNTPEGMVTVWAAERQEDYTYDKAGNRDTTRVDFGVIVTNTWVPNSKGGHSTQLKSDARWNYFYDANGNTTAKAKKLTAGGEIDPSAEYWQYQWDLHSRLTGVLHNGGWVASYTYEVDNHRIKKTAGSGTTQFTYGRNGALAYQINPDGTQRNYLYLGGTLVGLVDTTSNGTTSTYFVVTDHLGSVTAVTNAAGATVWRSDYGAFGQVMATNSGFEFDGSYAGHEVDTDAQLISMWNRWMDPETGRFLSEDPARDGGNWYSYVQGNPLSLVDPTGLKTGDQSDDISVVNGTVAIVGDHTSTTDIPSSSSRGKNPDGPQKKVIRRGDPIPEGWKVAPGYESYRDIQLIERDPTPKSPVTKDKEAGGEENAELASASAVTGVSVRIATKNPVAAAIFFVSALFLSGPPVGIWTTDDPNLAKYDPRYIYVPSNFSGTASTGSDADSGAKGKLVAPPSVSPPAPGMPNPNGDEDPNSGLPKSLKFLHSKDSVSTTTLAQLNKLTTQELADSLKSGAERLVIKSNGVVMNGNHRLMVLQSRGYNIDSLIRYAELYKSAPLGP